MRKDDNVSTAYVALTLSIPALSHLLCLLLNMSLAPDLLCLCFPGSINLLQLMRNNAFHELLSLTPDFEPPTFAISQA
jgi:hypothetical protein